MKKYLISCITLIIVIALIILSIVLFKSKNKEEIKNDKEVKTIKIAEVTHSIFYAPLYVSIENGYFEDEGINVDLILTSGADNVASAVLSKDVEIGFAGPESAVYVYNAGNKDYLQVFAGLTKRDGQFIVSRKKINNFKLEDLKGKEVLGGRIGGMPLLNFQTALKNEKIKESELKINTSVDFADLSSAFIAGTGDFVNLFEPNATKLENEGYGYVVASVGKYSGEVPYTAFYAQKSFIKENKNLINNFRKALNKGIKFVENNSTDKIAKVILNQFPSSSLDEIKQIVKRYKDADSWLKDTKVPKEYFENLEDIMISSGKLNNYVNYNDLVINE